MKTAPDKLKMSITLDEYTTQLLREAVKLAMPNSEKYGNEKQDRRRMVHFALMAFLRAVILYRYQEVAAYGRHVSGKFREARFVRIRTDKTFEVNL